MSFGKQRRMSRIFDTISSKAVIVPLDHGFTLGPVAGIERLRPTVDDVVEGGANAVLMHKGMVRNACCDARHFQAGLIVHLSASTRFSSTCNTKTLVGTVEEAVALGADGVSVHLNIGDDAERHMLAEIGCVSRECEQLGMPLLVMAYARGKHIPDAAKADAVAHCARVAEELGADFVKVAYSGCKESFARVVAGCTIPVLIAGGEGINSEQQLLTMVREALQAGCAGVSIGRSLFQSPHRVQLLRELNKLVHHTPR